MSFQSLRGMADLLPEQINLWQHIERISRIHFSRAGVKEIRTPILEMTELFDRGIGEATDVSKEMYSFLDKGNRSCTLRPEGTASVVRAAIQHGLLNQGSQRLWYSGPMFRYERPQNGRLRQFHQIGIEMFGIGNRRADVEAICIAWDLLSSLGLRDDLTLEINSLGTLEDQAFYKAKLCNWLNSQDPNLLSQFYKNPMRILDSKDSKVQELLGDAPSLTDFLSEESLNRFSSVCQGLEALNIPFKINSRLVRGLDYYNHTIFEFTSNNLGAQTAVCGGGRYDSLVKDLGGLDMPAIGWALGIERIMLLMQNSRFANIKRTPDLYVVNRGEAAEKHALYLTSLWRHDNLVVELDLSGSTFSKQLRKANRSGARWVAMIGDDEVSEGTVILKDMQVKENPDRKISQYEVHHAI